MTNLFPPTPASARRELVLILDAIEQLMAAVHLHYRRIQVEAAHYGMLPREAETLENETARDATESAIVADVGSFIGTVHRLRLLVNRLPGEPATRLAKKAFETEVKQLEDARHRLEHLDTAVAEIANTGEGAFGAVSWWENIGDEERRLVFFLPGTLAEGAEAVNRMPKQVRGRIDNVWVTIAGKHLEVTVAYGAVVRLESRLREWGTAQAEKGWPALLE